MTTINDLAQIDAAADADKLMLYSEANSATRAITIANIRAALASLSTDTLTRIAQPDGAALVGYGSSTVGDTLNALPSEFAAKTNSADLAASGGSALVGFQQAGAGTVARAVRDRLRDTLNVKDFGANGDGTTDDTAALTALAAYVNAIPLTSRPVSIRFTQGVYKYSDGLWFKRPVSIFSDGATLNYTGTGKALELGADGIANFDVFLQGEYTVDGLRFTGGATATHGVYVNDYVIEPRIRNCTFEDYGNSTSIDIFSQFEVWDVLVENCRKLTYSSSTAVGNFIAITGRNKANTADDGGNSRVTIRDCWMTSYSDQELGYFAYVNAVKSRIIGGGFQHSKGGIRLGGNASFTTIDNVYAEISTASSPHYITVLSNDAGGGNFSWPQGVVIRGGYANMHSDVITNTGRIIKVGDANVKLLNWKIDGFAVANYANGQVLIEQNDLTGQTGNSYGGIVRYYNPVVLDDGHRFVLRGAYTNAEKWASFDVENGVWTPTLGGTSTYTTQTGKFVRNGNTVTVSFDVQVNALGTGNTSQLYGLPYSCGSLTCAGEIGYFNSLALSVYSLNARVDGGNNWITFSGLTAAATGVAGSLAIFGNTTRIIGTLSYVVDDPL